MFTWEGNKTSNGNETLNQTQLYKPGTISSCFLTLVVALCEEECCFIYSTTENLVG